MRTSFTTGRAFPSLLSLFASRHQQHRQTQCFSRTTLRALSLAQHSRYPTGRPSSSPSSALSAFRDRRSSTSSNSITTNINSTTAANDLLSQEEQARIRRTGQAKRRLEKSVRREDRIAILESSKDKSDSEQAELTGLYNARLQFEEQYDPSSFSNEHVEFKRLHNQAFLALIQYCQEARRQSSTDAANVFFLDGPDAGTASFLIHDGGMDPSQCHVANRHFSTCQVLRKSGGGLLPDQNVLCATAAEALTTTTGIGLNGEEGKSAMASFADIDFCAYYFDGCGGFVPHVVGMMTAALLRDSDDNNNLTPTAVGFSIMGGNKNVVEKELAICRALATIARTNGMTTRHVLDDPERYGISPEIPKTGGDGTFTSWILLEKDKA